MTPQPICIVLLAAFAVPATAQSTPAAGPPPLGRAAYMQSIDRGFVAVDANKDGFADKAEMEAAQTRAAAARKAELLRSREVAFRRLDTNKDNSLTLQEFNSAAASAPLVNPDAAPILSRFDTNKDGRISLVENRVPAMAKFDRADTNKDGSLSDEEQRAASRR